MFAARPVSQAAQAELLEALDKTVTPEAAAAAEGTNADGSIPITELEAARRSMPRGKAPGLDYIPYEFYQLRSLRCRNRAASWLGTLVCPLSLVEECDAALEHRWRQCWAGWAGEGILDHRCELLTENGPEAP
ncbi:g7996 [Coccomyxa elongata]